MKKELKDEVRAACATLAEAIISAVGNAKPEATERTAANADRAAKEAEAIHKVIQKTVFQTAETWNGTSDDLCRLVLASPEVTEADKELFHGGIWIGRMLATLALRFPDCYILCRTARVNCWKLRAVKE
jgi:hypothetical protein